VPSHHLLALAERAWRGYLEVTAGLSSEADRADLIGARVATLKRLPETVGRVGAKAVAGHMHTPPTQLNR
jgi:hypothetical protein